MVKSAPRSPKYRMMHPMPTYPDEHNGLRQAARELAQGQLAERAADIDKSEAYPWDNVADLVVDMNIKLEAARGLVHQAASSAGFGFPDITAAARAKILAADSAIAVTNDAL